MPRNGGDLRPLVCPVCTREVVRPAHVRHCSRECGRIARVQSRAFVCTVCGGEFRRKSYGGPVGLCAECRKVSGGKRIAWLTCPICGITVRRQARYRTCSRQCGNKLQWAPRKVWGNRRERIAAKSARRRMRMRGSDGRIEAIDPAAVAERDGWICGICGDPVSPGLAYPAPLSASLDHTVPLSLGGEHTWTNVRLAHLVCNCERGNRS